MGFIVGALETQKACKSSRNESVTRALIVFCPDMYPLILVVILMMIFPGRVRLSVRVYAPFIVFLGIFALLPISAILFPPFFGFLVAMFCTVVVGLADAVSQVHPNRTL